MAEAVRVLSTNGDTFLGGEDFDMRLIEYSRRIQEENGHRSEERSRFAMQRLRKRPEAKIELSSSQQTRGPALHHARATGPKHLW